MANTLEITINGITELTSAVLALNETLKNMQGAPQPAVDKPLETSTAKTRKKKEVVEDAAQTVIPESVNVQVPQVPVAGGINLPPIDFLTLKKALIAFDAQYGIEGLRELLNRFEADRASQLRETQYAAVLQAIESYGQKSQ